MGIKKIKKDRLKTELGEEEEEESKTRKITEYEDESYNYKGKKHGK